jgi:hypothetical protein
MSEKQGGAANWRLANWRLARTRRSERSDGRTVKRTEGSCLATGQSPVGWKEV